MLSCFQGKTNKVFQHILRFYCKKKGKVLDLTYGRGLSWEDCEQEYDLIKIDKRKLPDVIRADLNNYLKEAEDGQFDCVYFDPPYYYTNNEIKRPDIKDQLLNEETEVFWQKREFKQAIKTIEQEVCRILRPKGVLIVKIMDNYEGSEYYPQAFKVFESIEKVLTPKAILICPIKRKDTIMRFIRPNHIYYLVFKKEVERK